MYPLTLLLGIRRAGKSSILRAYLNENLGILIDCRELYAERGYITSYVEDYLAVKGYKTPERGYTSSSRI